MITSTMTGEELYKYFCRDRGALINFMDKKAAKLKKELRCGMKAKVSQCYDYLYKGVPYKLSVIVSRNAKYYCADVFIYVKETNDYVSVALLDLQARVAQYSLTTHFLHRFAERYLHRVDMSINTILTKYQRHVIYTVVIYNDGKRYVVASNAGLILQEMDERRGIRVCKTFVSLEMLKSSQIATYEKVAWILEKYSKICDVVTPIDGKRISEDFNNELNAHGITAEMLYEAYGEYFKKKEQYEK